ncbi:hypothetical protein E4U19_002398 [Claviceps sp. Clav32 group G5]|nr:hypothetical protein E4U19_002398 [Claviceps sp. Clav32 group G5]KAG6051205.1 hypothetical protein E4U39_001912 [Claviceps sp. Clav50 group G5]
MYLPPLKPYVRPVARVGRTHAAFLKRQYPVDDTNTQVSIAVGIVLGVFLIASGTFLYVYRSSIRCRRRRHRHHPAGKSSRSSSNSAGSAQAAPPASQGAPGEGEPTAPE